MKLGGLFVGISDANTAGIASALNETVRGITDDSRKVVAGDVFICVQGAHFDGHDKAAEALQKGACAVVAERDLGLPRQVLTENSRRCHARLCANWFGNPTKALKLIGVTGTNGKTTTTKVIQQVLTAAGHKVGLIGTNQNEIGGEVLPAGNTTPEPMELQGLFARMRDAGCDYVVMEVSSQALAQYRITDEEFVAAVFTNLTQDHLDYHNDMESYYQAKRLLFNMTRLAVINIDDPAGKRLLSEVACRAVTCSTHATADYFVVFVKNTAEGVRYWLRFGKKAYPVRFAMPGLFNVSNSMQAAAVCLELGLPPQEVFDALERCEGVKGRSEVIPTGRGFTVICDYAHTPDGLYNILPTVRSYTKGRLICLFGCGGDRDKTKRPLMGEAAAKLSDLVIVTSDNPRSEDPDAIIDDVMAGVSPYNTECVRITDRREAIFHAVSIARPGDTILLAGKGHEDYQVLKDGKIHFDEREIVAQALRNLHA